MQECICGKQVCILETRISNMAHYSIPQYKLAGPPHSGNSHSNNPCPIQDVWAFPPHCGLAPLWVTV